MATMSVDRPRISQQKIIIALASVALAGVASWFLQPWYHNSENAVIVLVTVFSILAGFLAAVMAIVANDRVLRGRNWRQDTYYLRLIRNELLRHKLTFYIYLMVLVLAFLTTLDSSWPSLAQQVTEHALLFFTTLGIVHSFQLPEVLSRKHVSAMEHQIRRRREKETGEGPGTSSN
ncbi:MULTISPECIES: hypothetical protein [Halomonas]|uniref:Uncharacterized protein n=1 Tax=Halomonas halophila TaxID=29573 RepID=A0ABQ0U043_9GAMM|nr:MULTISPECIES: hypothetical protein [Halomonas]MDR5889641.1 hypothetical protein [Halomonas salina]WJY06323.1 hypothetical protein QWG60_11455 [Halomonas halophila]GEK71590.1 hypothetical protein HHA04nite_01340 [Halomonas halophila]